MRSSPTSQGLREETRELLRKEWTLRELETLLSLFSDERFKSYKGHWAKFAAATKEQLMDVRLSHDDTQKLRYRYDTIDRFLKHEDELRLIRDALLEEKELGEKKDAR
jgi:hypothetical protein